MRRLIILRMMTKGSSGLLSVEPGGGGGRAKTVQGPRKQTERETSFRRIAPRMRPAEEKKKGYQDQNRKLGLCKKWR